MTFNLEHTDPLYIRLGGQVLGGPEAMEFSEAVNECLESKDDGCSLIIDLADVELMNSSGLGMLLAASKSVGNTGGNLALVGTGDHLKKLLTMTRLDSLFKQYQTREEATEALSRP